MMKKVKFAEYHAEAMNSIKKEKIFANASKVLTWSMEDVINVIERMKSTQSHKELVFVRQDFL